MGKRGSKDRRRAGRRGAEARRATAPRAAQATFVAAPVAVSAAPGWDARAQDGSAGLPIAAPSPFEPSSGVGGTGPLPPDPRPTDAAPPAVDTIADDAARPAAASAVPDASPALAVPPAASLAHLSPAVPIVRVAFTPQRVDAAGIAALILDYMRGEAVAAAEHLRALAAARSPTEAIRRQVDEFERAADASLACWGLVMSEAARMFTLR